MKPLPFFILLSMIVGFIAGYFAQTHKGTSKPQSNEFYNGQVLLPDYAHLDTLIVTNADMLNVIFNNENCPETDGEIYETLHIFCDSYEGSFQDQFNKLKALRPTWDSLTIATAINED